MSNNYNDNKMHTDEKLLLKTQVEILKRKIIDRNFTIVQMEANIARNLPHEFAQGQLSSLRATCDNWQDKYERLLEAHKRLQKVNQGLEDKLLKLADKGQSEKAKMHEINTRLTNALTTASQAVNRLKHENECYQKDLNLATNLLQCNPSQYASYKLNTLPLDLHQQAKNRLPPSSDTPTTRKEPKIIRVPIPSFPPSAAAFSAKCDRDEDSENEIEDQVSAAILAAIIEEREKERSQRHCPTCSCEKICQDRPGRSQSGSNTRQEYGATHISNESSHINNESDLMSFSPFSSSLFDVRAIDVGTQTLPSYIGERGNVASSCIYCKSNNRSTSDCASSGDGHNQQFSTTSMSITNRSDNSESNAAFHRSFDSKIEPQLATISSSVQTKSLVHPTNSSQPQGSKSTLFSSSWEWQNPESFDSGAPSSPSSFTSPSSCFTSPGDSPGHFKDAPNCFPKPNKLVHSQSLLSPGDATQSSERENKHISLSMDGNCARSLGVNDISHLELNEELISDNSSSHNVPSLEFSKLCFSLLSSGDQDMAKHSIETSHRNDASNASVSIIDLPNDSNPKANNVQDLSTYNIFDKTIKEYSIGTNPSISLLTDQIDSFLPCLKTQQYDNDFAKSNLIISRPSDFSSSHQQGMSLSSDQRAKQADSTSSDVVKQELTDDSIDDVSCSLNWSTDNIENSSFYKKSLADCTVFKTFPSETSV